MRVAVFGQIAGPIGGQSRLTEAYRDGRGLRTYFFEFWGHKSAIGPFQMIAQFLAGLVLATTGRVDAAYIALSRSNFGMLRDILMLLPFILTRIPVVAHVHGAEFDTYYLQSPHLGRIKSWFLKRIARFIFVNEVFVPSRPDLVQRSTFVRNPIPHFAVPAFSRTNQSGLEPVGRRQFGFISTFAKEKGIDLFLDAAQEFGDRADFIVAGGPSIENPNYGEEVLVRLKQMDMVRYLGYLSDPTPFYDVCDFMIFPTNFASETSSLVVIEALATRTRPIVRRHNRLVDIFGDAPIDWFDGSKGLEQAIKAALVMPKPAFETSCDAGQKWVQDYFPTEDQWVVQVEAVVEGATKLRKSRSLENSPNKRKRQG